MRKAIDNYHDETRHWPKTLKDLVPKYLSRVPPDPITGSAKTWKYNDGGGRRIAVVKSGAVGATCDNVPYGEL